jgi:2-polyprenyl-3-methyl-5-hydroxy-6-metoxy-1,4-benzoquinol methylase
MKYFYKDKKIIDLVKNKKVLHLGCVGFADLETSDRVKLVKKSLHYSLTEIADTIGIDYCSDAIRFYKDKGIFNNVLFGNVEELESVDINETFEVIVAGDIIEHLSNPGLMLEGVKRFCTKDTIIIITTPNSFGLMSYIRFILGKFIEGNEHVMSFNFQNIKNLLYRNNFTINSVNTCYQKHAKTKPLFFVGNIFFKFFPKFGGTMFIVAKYDSI